MNELIKQLFVEDEGDDMILPEDELDLQLEIVGETPEQRKLREEKEAEEACVRLALLKFLR